MTPSSSYVLLTPPVQALNTCTLCLHHALTPLPPPSSRPHVIISTSFLSYLRTKKHLNSMETRHLQYWILWFIKDLSKTVFQRIAKWPSLSKCDFIKTYHPTCQVIIINKLISIDEATVMRTFESWINPCPVVRLNCLLLFFVIWNRNCPRNFQLEKYLYLRKSRHMQYCIIELTIYQKVFYQIYWYIYRPKHTWCRIYTVPSFQQHIS